MGRPVGTVKSWRARGRERLRQRLTRAGLAPSVGLSAVTTPEMNEAIRAVLARLTAGAVPASVGVLVKGVLKTMFIKKLGAAAVMVGALAVAAAGVGSLARVAADDPPNCARRLESRRPRGARRDPDDETWPLTLREAIRIGAGATGQTSGSSRRDRRPTECSRSPRRTPRSSLTNSRPWSWPLTGRSSSNTGSSQQHVQLWAATKAVQIAEETIKREQEPLKVGRRLDQFRFEVETGRPASSPRSGGFAACSACRRTTAAGSSRSRRRWR